ncbi:MAG: V-type ATP synthase subunit C [Lentisphaerae bacterium ADurb.Bin082]|nr:MAG: V-type ATP synthase subunit C [Lentisphaerae bacterium ADurb.Bin082]
MKPLINVSHDFIFTKLHGMWANAIRGDALQRLIKSTTVENLQRELTALGFAETRRDSFHKELIKREMAILNSIRDQLGRRMAAFYDALIARVYYENLKTILNYRFLPELEADITALLVELPWLPEFPTSALLKTEDVDAFLSRLPLANEQDAEPLSAIIRELNDSLDIMAAECAVDQLFYANLLARARAATLDVRSELCRLVRREIDIVNLCMLLRNVRTYHLPLERMSTLWIQDGDALPVTFLDALATLPSHLDVVRHLPRRFQALLEPFVTADLYLSENTLWNAMFQDALLLFRNFDRPALSIAAYPFLLRSETLNLSRVFEGVHFGIPSRDMRDMMIGA